MTATTRTSAADRRLTVTVGPAEELDVTEITATRPVWTGWSPAAEPVDCLVQLRAHGEVHSCTAWPDGETTCRSARRVAKARPRSSKRVTARSVTPPSARRLTLVPDPVRALIQVRPRLGGTGF